MRFGLRRRTRCDPHPRRCRCRCRVSGTFGGLGGAFENEFLCDLTETLERVSLALIQGVKRRLLRRMSREGLVVDFDAWGVALEADGDVFSVGGLYLLQQLGGELDVDWRRASCLVGEEGVHSEVKNERSRKRTK